MPGIATFIACGAFPGQRFEVVNRVTVSSAGATLVASSRWEQGNGKIFAAIVSLDSPMDSPGSDDLSSSDVLGATTLLIPSQERVSENVAAKLLLDLDPGWYAIVLGSGRFGATAQAGVTLMPLAGQLLPIGGFGDSPTGWFNDTFGAIDDELLTQRMFVDTELVPEPATSVVLVTVYLCLFGRKARWEGGEAFFS